MCSELKYSFDVASFSREYSSSGVIAKATKMRFNFHIKNLFFLTACSTAIILHRCLRLSAFIHLNVELWSCVIIIIIPRNEMIKRQFCLFSQFNYEKIHISFCGFKSFEDFFFFEDLLRIPLHRYLSIKTSKERVC